VVNVGGGPKPFQFRGQYALKAELPRVIAVSLCAAAFISGWHKSAGERWYGCSLWQWPRSEQKKRGPLRITITL
jgi:hypothetical protein